MTINPLYFDIFILIIFIIVGFLAFLKGFIKDFFSTLNLLIATITSYSLYPLISQFITDNYSTKIFVNLGLRFLIFVVVLIICSIISSKISDPLSNKMPNFVNQSLGLAFGFSKCYFLFAFLLAIVVSFYSIHPSKNLQKDISFKTINKNNEIQIDWLEKTKSYDLLKYGSKELEPIAKIFLIKIENNLENKELIKEKKESEKKSIYDIDSENYNIDERLNNLKKTEEPVKKDTEDKAGYSKEEIKKMKRLIEIMSK